MVMFLIFWSCSDADTRTAGKCWRQKTPFCLKLSSNAQKSVLSWSISISRILGARGMSKHCNNQGLLHPGEGSLNGHFPPPTKNGVEVLDLQFICDVLLCNVLFKYEWTRWVSKWEFFVLNRGRECKGMSKHWFSHGL